MNSPKPVLCLADRSHNLLTYGEEAIRRVRLEPPVFHWHVGHERVSLPLVPANGVVPTRAGEHTGRKAHRGGGALTVERLL